MNYRVYAKFPNMGTFKALDLSNGAPVNNLIYATIIEKENLGKTEDYLKLVKGDQPEVQLQIRNIETNQTIFSI
jgi:hypothetical protein